MPIHTCTYGAVGAFATGVGATDMAAAMIREKLVQSTRNHQGKLKERSAGGMLCYDIILTIIGKIGAEEAITRPSSFTVTI